MNSYRTICDDRVHGCPRSAPTDSDHSQSLSDSFGCGVAPTTAPLLRTWYTQKYETACLWSCRQVSYFADAGNEL